MSKTSRYWLDRQAEQISKYTDASHKAIRKKYISYYKQSLKEVERLMTGLYLEILDEEGKPSANELYKYNRLFKMREELVKALADLGYKNLKELERGYRGVYKYSVANTLSEVNQSLMNKDIDVLVKEMWDARGKHWSTNVWCSDGLDVLGRMSKNMSKLQDTLEKGLLDCVQRGVPKDELVKTLRDRFNVSYSEADRLARTELNYIQNQGTLDSYKKAGIQEYRYLAHEDERSNGDICCEKNGNTYSVLTATVGVDYPPMHPNCRCTTIPVLNF